MKDTTLTRLTLYRTMCASLRRNKAYKVSGQPIEVPLRPLISQSACTMPTVFLLPCDIYTIRADRRPPARVRVKVDYLVQNISSSGCPSLEFGWRTTISRSVDPRSRSQALFSFGLRVQTETGLRGLCTCQAHTLPKAVPV